MLENVLDFIERIEDELDSDNPNFMWLGKVLIICTLYNAFVFAVVYYLFQTAENPWVFILTLGTVGAPMMIYWMFTILNAVKIVLTFICWPISMVVINLMKGEK